jgi:succinyl-diaminopimelate desuccinylase
MTAVEKLLCELIALPSVNPAFLPAHHPNAGEKRVADFLAATAGKAGLDVELQEVLPGRPNLLARLSPRGKIKQRILLAPHLDTVNAAHDKQFTPEIKGGRIYGRGACDTKGNVAAMLSALMQVAKNPNRPAETEIVFAGLIDEEDQLRGSQALVKSMKADFAIVGESTKLEVITAHKGSLWLRFETAGRAAHGSMPDLGKNAIHEMARIVDFLETDYARRLRKRRHPLLRCATANVGQISGGTQPNIVPAQCMIVVDRRTLPGETEASVCRELQDSLRQRKLRATITNNRTCPALPMETDPNHPLVQQMLRAMNRTRTFGVDYFCDASVLSHSGIPSVVFGPGDIAQAHTANEWISMRSLERGTAMLRKFLEALP